MNDDLDKDFGPPEDEEKKDDKKPDMDDIAESLGSGSEDIKIPGLEDLDSIDSGSSGPDDEKPDAADDEEFIKDAEETILPEDEGSGSPEEPDVFNLDDFNLDDLDSFSLDDDTPVAEASERLDLDEAEPAADPVDAGVSEEKPEKNTQDDDLSFDDETIIMADDGPSLEEIAPEEESLSTFAEETIMPEGEPTMMAKPEKRARRSKAPIFLLLIAVFASAGYYYFSGMGLFECRLKSFVSRESAPSGKTAVMAEPLHPLAYYGARNLEWDRRDGVTTLIYEAPGNMEDVRSYYGDSLVKNNYKLSSESAHGGTAYLVYSREGSDLNIMLRERDGLVTAYLSYLE